MDKMIEEKSNATKQIRMACLNRELLYVVARKLIEDGDQDAVNRFGLSGKEPFGILRNVFASAKTLMIFDNSYAIGWGQRYAVFEVGCDKPHVKSWMDYIGFSVQHLVLECSSGKMEYYQRNLDQIIHKKQLKSLCVGSEFRHQKYALKIILSSFATIKRLQIPSSLMTKQLQHCLNLTSLTFLDNDTEQYLTNCCKTTSMTMNWANSGSRGKYSPYVSTVKHLTFNDSNTALISIFYCFDVLPTIMKYFSNVEHIECKIFVDNTRQQDLYGRLRSILMYIDRIRAKDVAPLKITFSFFCGKMPSIFFSNLRKAFQDKHFVEDESIPELCFQKNMNLISAHKTVIKFVIYE